MNWCVPEHLKHWRRQAREIIGKAFQQWGQLRELKGLKSDDMVAVFLLQCLFVFYIYDNNVSVFIQLNETWRKEEEWRKKPRGERLGLDAALKRCYQIWLALQNDHSTFKFFGVITDRPQLTQFSGCDCVGSISMSTQQLSALQLYGWKSCCPEPRSNSLEIN